MKILHTADWHAGRVLHGQPRTPEIREVLREIAELARTEAVDLVLVAGDLYDTRNPGAEAEAAVYEFFKTLGDARIPSVVIAGNHDAPGRLATRVDLSLNPNLRHLALEGTAPNILACLLNILPQVKNLEVLTLTLRHAVYYPDAMRIMEEYPWGVLDRALSGVEGMRGVRITVLDSLTRQELGGVRDWVWEKLSKASGRYCAYVGV